MDFQSEVISIKHTERERDDIRFINSSYVILWKQNLERLSVKLDLLIDDMTVNVPI